MAKMGGLEWQTVERERNITRMRRPSRKREMKDVCKGTCEEGKRVVCHETQVAHGENANKR